ncbi:MAG: methyl-accepting chemotaxis protein [Treponema sp.]
MNNEVLQAGINLSTIMMDYCAKYTGVSDILQAYSEQITDSSGIFEQEKAALDKLSETGKDINQNIANIIENYAANALSVEEISSSFAKLEEKVAEIETATKLSTETLQHLSEQMNTITEYMDTIKEISKQTNLLSINASIEAARAGSAGTGFKIIAGQVKKLSETTESSSHEITTRLKTFTAQIKNLETEQNTHKTMLRSLISMTGDSRQRLAELKSKEENSSNETKNILNLLKANTLNIENAVEAIKENEKQGVQRMYSFADKASETTLLFNDFISFILEISEIFKYLQSEQMEKAVKV